MANPRRVPARVHRLVDHGEGVFSVWLRTEEAAPRFKPGQFLHLALDAFDPASGYWPESRVFSIASTPGSPDLRIVYAVKGRYTRRMSQELAEGKSVWLKYPFGEFVVDPARCNGACVLVAGGTGITPFVGLLGAEGRRIDSVWLYYGVRSRDLVIFQEELKCAVNARGLHLEVCIEQPRGEDPPGLAARIGRLDIEAIHAAHRADGSARFFLSGPPEMIRSFKDFLLARSVSEQCVLVDAWE